MPPKQNNLMATQQPPTKRTRFTLLKGPNSKLGCTDPISLNQTHEPSTHRSSHHHQAAATPLKSNTSDYSLLTHLPIPLPSDSVQNRGALVPHEVLKQL